MRLTTAQQQAIAHRGSSLLVAASAGSGKTEVLARRCVDLIGDPAGPCGVEQLLVVTFTRAAAAELRVRIARMLRAAAAKTRDVALARHLRMQEVLVDVADIGTIDAWCGRVVREFAGRCGVDPGFGVLSEQDTVLLRQRVLDALMDEVHRGAGELAREAQAWLARAPVPGDRFLRELVTALNRFREQLTDPEGWLAEQAADLAREDAAEILAGALRDECAFQHAQLGELWPAGGDDGLAEYAARVGAWAERLADPAVLLDVVREIQDTRLPKGQAESAVLQEVRARWLKSRLQDAWDADTVNGIVTQQAEAAQRVGVLLRLEARYEGLLQVAKRQLGRYAFGDVQRLALALLGERAEGGELRPTEVALRLQRRYAHVLVDEFQDTSPVQVALLRLVTRRAAGTTNAFMVGDVKQSIYGFRQAEPRLFVALRERLERGLEEGALQFLSDNFRSHAGVLEPLNRVFAQLFDPELGGTTYAAEEQLRAGRAAVELANPTLDGRPRVSVQVLEEPRSRAERDEDEALVERIEREAQVAADEIRAMFVAGVRVPRQGADGAVTLEPLRRKDIVILLRSARQNAGRVARVLRSEGIPCATGGRESLLESLEVGDVRSVLELLANRRQDVPLAAYLRGPLMVTPEEPDGALTPAELRAVRQGSPEGDFHDAVERYRAVRADAAVAAKLDRAWARLDRWGRMARELELPELLRGILQETGLVSLARSGPGGAQRVALLRSLQRLAESFVAGGGGDAAEFVAYLEALEAEEAEPGGAAAGDDDVVRIMTIHGAKGLEFPVVLLLGMGAAFNRDSQQRRLQCHEVLGMGLRVTDYVLRGELVSARHHVGVRRVARRDLEEELRLLYVALTRARERVVIIGHAEEGMWAAQVARYAESGAKPALISRLSVRNRLEWVLMAVASARWAGQAVEVTTRPAADVRVLVEPSTVRDDAARRGALSAAETAWVDESVRRLTTRAARPRVQLSAVWSVSAAKEAARRVEEADRPAVWGAGEAALAGPEFAEGARVDGRTLGTACHRFLEAVDLARLGSEAQVAGEVRRLVDAGWLTAEEGALVPVADVAWLGSTAVGTLLGQTGADVRREVPFVCALPVKEADEHVLLRGAIDAMVVSTAGVTLVDYKTDRVRDEEELAARLAGYRVQMQLYAHATAALFDRPIQRAVLVFLRMRRVVDVEPAQGSPAALLDLLAAAGRGRGSGVE